MAGKSDGRFPGAGVRLSPVEQNRVWAVGSGHPVLLVIPSSPEYLRIVRAVVREFGGIGGWSREDVRAVTLAVDEACSNIIRHAYGGAADRPIHVSLRQEGGFIRIELVDQGEPVDPERVRPRKLDDVRPGGLGLHLIRNLMDEVRFDTEHTEGNRLILSRRITRDNDDEP